MMNFRNKRFRDAYHRILGSQDYFSISGRRIDFLMLTHTYILGICPKGPLMKPNASELCSLRGAWGSGSVVRGDVSGPPAAEPGAAGEPTGSNRGQTI